MPEIQLPLISCSVQRNKERVLSSLEITDVNFSVFDFQIMVREDIGLFSRAADDAEFEVKLTLTLFSI